MWASGYVTLHEILLKKVVGTCCWNLAEGNDPQDYLRGRLWVTSYRRGRVVVRRSIWWLSVCSVYATVCCRPGIVHWRRF